MKSSFEPVADAARLMDGFPGTWFVSGGWAIDLFLGVVTREHEDIEIGIYRPDQCLLRQHFRGFQFEKVFPSAQGGQWVSWQDQEVLHLPVHQIRVTRAAKESLALEFLLNECDGGNWVSRRHPGLVRPLGQVFLQSSLGIPILAPEIQLLFKAKQTRPKDQADFVAACHRLSPGRRKWLGAVMLQFYPAHPWRQTIDNFG